MDNQIIKIIAQNTIVDEQDTFNTTTKIFNMLAESKELYPGFFNWYFRKFVPGLRDGSRKIIVSYVEGEIGGVALIKNDGVEKKICGVRVNGKYRKMGIGVRLFRECLEVLNTTKPMVTVSSERLSSFSKILKYYDFKLEQINKGYYRENSNEYVFNGSLDTTTSQPRE